MGRLMLEGVGKLFGAVNIIRDANLDIEDGSFVVFVGPSGCGKTTLLRLIAGLEDVTGGKILIDGHNVVDVPPAKRGLSMVFQSYALYPHMSVRGNIAFGLKMAGLPRPEIERKVEAAAATLNLTAYLDRKPRDLSGGQRSQRRDHRRQAGTSESRQGRRGLAWDGVGRRASRQRHLSLCRRRKIRNADGALCR